MSKLETVWFFGVLIVISIVYLPFEIFDIIIGVLDFLLSEDADFEDKITDIGKRNLKRYLKICKAVKLIGEDGFNDLLDLVNAMM